MRLSAGDRLGPYEIGARIGAGGMGEVYGATDTRLGRSVAVKLCAERFNERFEREARAVAALNHPNICQLYDVGPDYLVMELIEGCTLAERIAQGPLPLEEALRIARQVAEALEAAHEKGIIHRDLKPANIKLTPDGAAKVLDFGLAKRDPETRTSDPANSPTFTMATQADVILGTAAYMPPEQARGAVVDRRADIWSFGAVLFEMLSGKQPFSGESVSDILAMVLKFDPDWGRLPAGTPKPVEKLLRRCLVKERKLRLQAIGEARIAIDEYFAGPPEPAAAVQASGRRPRLPWLWAGGFGAVAVLCGIGWWRAQRLEAPPQAAFTVPLLPAESFDLSTYPAIALSGDGQKLAYSAIANGVRHLAVKSSDAFQPKILPGTEGAFSPSFSPDGKWIAYFAESKLRKVGSDGGPPQVICDVGADPRGISWGPEDTIVFAPGPTSSLLKVSAGGGVAPLKLTDVVARDSERTHRWPQVVPGGKAAIFTVGRMDNPDYYDNARIDLVRLGTGERRTILDNASMAHVTSNGRLLFARDGNLFAVRFDLDKLTISGAPHLVLEGVATAPTTGAANFVVAGNGTLAFVPGDTGGVKNRIAWVNRKGERTFLPLPPRLYLEPALSPDGRKAALVIGNAQDFDIWVYDLDRSTLTRLTRGGTNRSPIWSRDGKQVAYVVRSRIGGGNPDSPSILFMQAADASTPAAKVTEFLGRVYLNSWSPDGKLLAVSHDLDFGPSRSVKLVDLTNGNKATPLFEGNRHVDECAFSPDGRRLAYASDETGRSEVYVSEMGGERRRWQISSDGGMEPRWSADGREIFFRSGNRMMAVAVETRGEFRAGAPQALFGEIQNVRTETNGSYSVAPKGDRFLIVEMEGEGSRIAHVRVVQNWHVELERRFSGGGTR